MDEKIDTIIIAEEKKIDEGQNLNGKGREKYDIEFNVACRNLDFKKVVELSETQYCNNYLEGMISLMLGDMTNQQNIKEIYTFLMNKIIYTKQDVILNVLIKDLISYSLQFNNYVILQNLLMTKKSFNTKEQYKKFFNSFGSIFFDISDSRLKTLNVQSFKILANEIKDNVPNKLIKFITYIRFDFCYDQRDQLLFDATLDYAPIFNYDSYDIIKSGILKPILAFLKSIPKRKEHLHYIAIGGNLETFKEIEKKYELNEVMLGRNIISAYKTTNKKGLDLILYLESKFDYIITYDEIGLITVPKIFEHAIKKYPISTEADKIHLFRVMYAESISYEIILLAYDNLVKHIPLKEIFYDNDEHILRVSNKNVQKKLSEREGYYDLVFNSPEYDDWEIFVSAFIINYEIIFKDIKNIPSTFLFSDFIKHLNKIFLPNEMEACIYLENFLQKNNLTHQTIDLLENKTRYSYLQEIFDEADEENPLTKEETLQLELYTNYYKIKEILDKKKNKKELEKNTMLLEEARAKLIITTDIKTMYYNHLLQSWRGYFNRLELHPLEFDMTVLKYLFINIVKMNYMLIDLYEEGEYLAEDDSDVMIIRKMNRLLSANTIYELAPYIIRIFSTGKNQNMINEMKNSTNLMNNLNRYVEKKKLIIRAIYARDMISPPSKQLGKDIQKNIMKYL